jgi:hypothetical protein
MDELITEIEAFLASDGMGISATRFGELALGDRHLVRQLREGRELRLKTAGKVRDFMRKFAAESASA